MNAHLLLLWVAVILWFIAAVVGFTSYPNSKLNLGWLGLFFYGLSLLVH